MSSRIEEILEVLREIRNLHETKKVYGPISKIRSDATRTIASRRKVGYNTICDKYQRQLGPEVKGTTDFDHLIEDWLYRGQAIKFVSILKAHAADNADYKRIDDFFDKRAINESKEKTIAETNSQPYSSSSDKALMNKKDSANLKQHSVILDDDVALVFTTSAAVNRALRSLIEIARGAYEK